MIRITVALSLVLGAVLFRFPAASYQAPAGVSVACQPLEGDTAYQTLVSGKGPRFLSRGASENLSADQSYFVPPLGEGYLAYSKMGKEISYFARPGELYWKRETASYPVTDLEGRLILLLSGDLTAVRLMDRNGNMESAAPLTGLVMTDYAFTNDWPAEGKGERLPAAAVLFASGPAYLILYGGSVKVVRLPIPDAEKAFAKSIALAKGMVAIHMGDAEGDFVRLYSVKDASGQFSLSLKTETKLPRVYPHRIAMTIVDGGVLLGTSEFVGLADGRMEWMMGPSGPIATVEAPPAQAAPGPEFQGDALLSVAGAIVGNGRTFVLTDASGWPLALAPGAGAFRLLPAVSGQTGLVIEDQDGYCALSLSRK